MYNIKRMDYIINKIHMYLSSAIIQYISMLFLCSTGHKNMDYILFLLIKM